MTLRPHFTHYPVDAVTTAVTEDAKTKYLEPRVIACR